MLRIDVEESCVACMRLGLLPTDAATSQNEPVKELSRLVKLGLLLCDAVVSQRKASKEQGRLVKLGLLPCDAVASQNKAVEELSQLMNDWGHHFSVRLGSPFDEDGRSGGHRDPSSVSHCSVLRWSMFVLLNSLRMRTSVVHGWLQVAAIETAVFKQTSWFPNGQFQHRHSGSLAEENAIVGNTRRFWQ